MIGTHEDSGRAEAILSVLRAASAEYETTPRELADSLAALALTPAAETRIIDQVHRTNRDQARLRRRKHELTVLAAATRELTGTSDTTVLLERLVQQVHDMLDADVSYLSEADPGDGRLRVRTAAGVAGSRFRDLAVPTGHGLAGIVAETRTAHWVGRYDQWLSRHGDRGGTQTNRYERSLDGAFAAEGVVSLLGVPMLSGGELLGVLFVGTRDEHVFLPEQIALLTTLADHASVLLRIARKLHDLDTFARRLAEQQQADALRDQLTQAALDGDGFTRVVETLAGALDRPVAVLDAYHETVATAGPPPSASPDTVTELSVGSRHFGVLLVGGDSGLDAAEHRSVEHAGQLCTLLALKHQNAIDAEHRREGELVRDLLGAAPERRSDVERRARRFGFPHGEVAKLVLFVVPADHREHAVRVLRSTLDGAGLVGRHEDFVVVLLAGGPAGDVRSLYSGVASALATTVLAVRSATTAATLATAFDAARRTARLLTALGIDDVLAAGEDYQPYVAVFEPEDHHLRAFLDATIGLVSGHDRENGTDLMTTLRAFVHNNASPTRTARELTFHPNTILQRLARLSQVLGPDWREDERFFRISFAVRLDELVERLHGPGIARQPQPGTGRRPPGAGAAEGECGDSNVRKWLA
ncbi:helix-turn-helix domain-containing protein [Amycolatopsis ultiminotia]